MTISNKPILLSTNIFDEYPVKILQSANQTIIVETAGAPPDNKNTFEVLNTYQQSFIPDYATELRIRGSVKNNRGYASGELYLNDTSWNEVSGEAGCVDLVKGNQYIFKASPATVAPTHTLYFDVPDATSIAFTKVNYVDDGYSTIKQITSQAFGNENITPDGFPKLQLSGNYVPSRYWNSGTKSIDGSEFIPQGDMTFTCRKVATKDFDGSAEIILSLNRSSFTIKNTGASVKLTGKGILKKTSNLNLAVEFTDIDAITDTIYITPEGVEVNVQIDIDWNSNEKGIYYVEKSTLTFSFTLELIGPLKNDYIISWEGNDRFKSVNNFNNSNPSPDSTYESYYLYSPGYVGASDTVHSFYDDFIAYFYCDGFEEPHSYYINPSPVVADSSDTFISNLTSKAFECCPCNFTDRGFVIKIEQI